jgi:hypothetical protein
MYLLAVLLLETEKLDRELRYITPEIIYLICKGQLIFCQELCFKCKTKESSFNPKDRVGSFVKLV